MISPHLRPTPPAKPTWIGSADLAVDLDGTLLITDTLDEGFVRALFTRPADAVKAVMAIGEGPAAVKRQLAEYSAQGAASFPHRADFLQWLEGQARDGRRLHLVTAAHQQVAEAVAERFGIFESVIATSNAENVKGPAKRDQGATVEAEFPHAPGGVSAWLKALRMHQWSKNLLMFIPLLLSGEFLHLASALSVAIGFVLMGLAASGTYIINDLSDLASDRAHRTKCRRPFAAGTLSVRAGVTASATLIALSVGVSAWFAPLFAAFLVGYIAMTLSYSLWFKKVAILDVAILAGLYGLRLGMGAVLASVVFSEWLIVFALFFFLSLSLAKRHVEIVRAAAVRNGPIPGRGYTTADGVLTLPLGLAAAMTSLLVMVLFLVFAAFAGGSYAHPEFLWAAPLLVFLWMSRVWLLAARGELEDDPVSFAVKDRLSLLLGVVLGVFTLLAVLDVASPDLPGLTSGTVLHR